MAKIALAETGADGVLSSAKDQSPTPKTMMAMVFAKTTEQRAKVMFDSCIALLLKTQRMNGKKLDAPGHAEVQA